MRLTEDHLKATAVLWPTLPVPSNDGLHTPAFVGMIARWMQRMKETFAWRNRRAPVRPG